MNSDHFLKIMDMYRRWFQFGVFFSAINRCNHEFTCGLVRYGCYIKGKDAGKAELIGKKLLENFL